MTVHADEKQLTRLAVLFGEHGITDRADRLRLCTDHAGRLITSSAQLTQREAAVLIGRLEALAHGNLPRVVAALVRAEEQDAAARATAHREDPNRILTPQEVADRLGGVIICGRGGQVPITEGLASTIEQLALDHDTTATGRPTP